MKAITSQSAIAVASIPPPEQERGTAIAPSAFLSRLLKILRSPLRSPALRLPSGLAFARKRGDKPGPGDQDQAKPEYQVPGFEEDEEEIFPEDEEGLEQEGEDDEDGDEEEGEEAALPFRGRSRSEWSEGSGRPDLELIEEFLAGKEEPFNRLVLKYQHKIFNLCQRILNDRQEAEDMAQEVFLTIHKSLKDFRGDSLFSTWIFRIAVNHCRNRIKHLTRRRYFQQVSIDQPQETDEGELYHELEDEAPDPESVIMSRQAQTLVQDAISALDEDHRLAIVLRDIEDLSYEEIAEVLEIKVGTVKSRIHRARFELKRKLEGKIKW